MKNYFSMILSIMKWKISIIINNYKDLTIPISNSFRQENNGYRIRS